MFRIVSLKLVDYRDKSYTYKFSEGINYFRGENNTGKTEFYKFIDFMFGSSMDLRNFDWYRDSLHEATMNIVVDGKAYALIRTDAKDTNYVKYDKECESERLSLEEYKEKINEIFSSDEVTLRRMREFVEENISYRAFTMFNFLGEKGQGFTRDFLDKCRDIKYAVRLTPVLNYIFNNHIEEIAITKKEIEELTDQIRKYEVRHDAYNFALQQINSNLTKVDSKIVFNGHNRDEVLEEISRIMQMKENRADRTKKSISDLEVIYSNLSEQIKVYDSVIKNYEQNERKNNNRKLLLHNFHELIQNDPNMEYLVGPLATIIEELDGSIAFGKYVINDETIKELRKQRDKVAFELKRQDAKHVCYSLEEKTEAVALIKAYLRGDPKDVGDELNALKSRLRDLKKELKTLQNNDDLEKINTFSDVVTELYKSGIEKSEIIKADFERDHFRIRYEKRGNILQPVEMNVDYKSERDRLYLGSMARLTLIQLTGYLAFMITLVNGNKCPIIPLLVFDHLSKPFSDDNKAAVGKIIDAFYKKMDKSEVQMFLFDDEEPDSLGIHADHYEQLRNEEKTGFSPFYKK